jgi:tetrahedral aminopeptidase
MSTDLRIDLLKKISETAGAPGFENRIREVIIKEITPDVDSITVDNMGNIVAFRKGKQSKKIMLAAHMDEIGFIVSHIDDNGFIRFIPLGGFDPKTLTAQRVIIHGKKDIIGVMGSKPIHLMSEDEKGKAMKLTDYYIDLGMKKEEVVKIVSIGDSVTRERELIEMGDCINGKSLDNRISVYVLIEALAQLKNTELPFDTYAVFTVQEEVGLRGAHVATLQIQPDFGIAIDTTIAFDVPGSQAHEQVSKLGEGAAIKIMDSSVIADQRMVAYLKKSADDAAIKWQPELLPAGGTDTANLQKMVKGGAIAGAISIPTRHIHSVIEMVHKSDVKFAIALLTEAVKNIDKLIV